MISNFSKGDIIPDSENYKPRYLIFDIYRGGMGIVFVVYDMRRESVFAMKTFKEHYFEYAANNRTRFIQESQSWINLPTHPNITEAINVEKVENQPCIFLEYVSGGNLADIIHSGKLAGNIQLVLDFALQFCDGMIHLKSHGINAHRDIKPQNCLITTDNILKITDFGLAKLNESYAMRPTPNERDHQASQTQSGIGFGTPAYMAPEQFLDARTANTRSDVYSFGVLLYEMLSGKTPFVYSQNETINPYSYFRCAHNETSIKSLPSKDKRLNALVFKCLEKDPYNRYSDFEQLRSELDEIGAGIGNLPINQLRSNANKRIRSGEDKGMSLYALGNYREAYAIYQGIMANLENQELDNEEKSKKYMRYGMILRKMGRYDEAIESYDRSLSLAPHNAEAYYNKGNLYMEDIGDMESAIKSYKNALEINEEHVDALYSLAGALAMSGKKHESIEWSDKAIQIYPRASKAWLNKGLALWETGRKDEGLDCVFRAISLEPDSVNILLMSGQMLELSSKYEGAYFCFNRVLHIDPTNELARSRMFLLSGLVGRPEEALSYANDYSDGTSSDRFVAKSGALYEARRYKEAVSEAEMAIDVEPSNKLAWLIKGKAQREIGKYDDARRSIERSLKIDNKFEEAWYCLGVTYERIQRHKEAFDCFERVSKMNPDRGFAWYKMGVNMTKMGNREKGLVYFEKAKRLDPRFAKMPLE